MDNNNGQKIWNLIGFISASKYRLKILSYLYSRSTTPSQLANYLKITTGHVSNLLQKMQNKELVKCMNPNLKKGRIYSITELGKKIYDGYKKLSEEKK